MTSSDPTNAQRMEVDTSESSGLTAQQRAAKFHENQGGQSDRKFYRDAMKRSA